MQPLTFHRERARHLVIQIGGPPNEVEQENGEGESSGRRRNPRPWDARSASRAQGNQKSLASGEIFFAARGSVEDAREVPALEFHQPGPLQFGGAAADRFERQAEIVGDV